MSTREPREITLAEIERQFELASYWWGAKWCPAVYAKAERGYGIRFLKSATKSWSGSSFSFDYFELDRDGVITTAPRGYAKQFKPGRVVDIEQAAERFAEPQADAMRIGVL